MVQMAILGLTKVIAIFGAHFAFVPLVIGHVT